MCITEGFEDEELVESKDVSKDSDDERRCPDTEIGEVGYVFRKQFDDGWYNGKVVKIRPGAVKGKDRRCRYTDGDEEDLSIRELQTLAKLDKMVQKKCPTGTVAACSTTSTRSSCSKKPDFNRQRAKRAGRCLSGAKTPRQCLCPKVSEKSLHDRMEINS